MNDLESGEMMLILNRSVGDEIHFPAADRTIGVHSRDPDEAELYILDGPPRWRRRATIGGSIAVPEPIRLRLAPGELEQVLIPGADASVQLLGTGEGRVRLGICDHSGSRSPRGCIRDEGHRFEFGGASCVFSRSQGRLYRVLVWLMRYERRGQAPMSAYEEDLEPSTLRGYLTQLNRHLAQNMPEFPYMFEAEGTRGATARIRFVCKSSPSLPPSETLAARRSRDNAPAQPAGSIVPPSSISDLEEQNAIGHVFDRQRHRGGDPHS